MINVLRRRAPGIRILLRPAKVQGEGAAADIAAGIADLNRQGVADVLIVGRGGGSLEDLWAFNEETVARAIAASAIPVISAVGHEVDVTIADFVADLRAPTPSAAAELVAKSRLELESHVDHLIMRLQSRVSQGLALWKERLAGLENRLHFAGRSWPARLELINQRDQRLTLAMHGLLQQVGARLAQGAGQLDALSPLNQLARGYVIASRDPLSREPVSFSELVPGGRLWLRFSAGRARTRIEEISD
jgi:exodeoxyribonuclease VII large subunit